MKVILWDILQHILQNYLKNLNIRKKYSLHNPCSAHLVQHILPGDHQKRVEFSEYLLTNCKKTKIKKEIV